MKNTIKTLINQVKKALTTRSALPEIISNSAYVDENGAIIAHDLSRITREPDHDIVIFIAGIVEDVAKREKLYSKDALTLAADTGIFNGGKELPEAYADLYKTPAEQFNYVTTIQADDLKAAAYCVSADRSRPVLTAIHLDVKGLCIESVDGFRAYRKKLTKALDVEALTPFERDNGLLIPGRAAAYNFKHEIAVYNSEKYLKLIDDAGLALYIKKTFQGAQYINLGSIYDGRGSYKRMNNEIKARIIDIKGFTSALKTATGAKDAHGKTTIVIRTRQGFIDYYIGAADIFGSIEAETEATPNGFNAIFNARYLYDAIANQECYTLELSKENNAPMYIGSGDACALVLPIRGGNERDFFRDYKPEAVTMAKPENQEAPATEAAPEAPAADPEKEAPAKDKFFAVPAALTNGMDENEKEALKRLNEKQNAENRFVNITAEDVKAEAEKIAAEKEATAAAENISAQVSEKLEIVKREEITPEIKEARELYRRLKKCGFTPNEYQEADALIIYKNNRELLKPIARAAGGLYIDTLAIIAAIMTIGDKLN